MKTYTLYQVDSFTTEIFKGNPAGVVIDADGLSDSDMQNIARELNNSETAFFLSPADPSHDGELRYFTPTTEVPSCGHATIGALYAKAIEENLPDCSLMIKTGIGLLPMEIHRHGNDYRIVMTQGRIEILDPLDETDRRDLLLALGIREEDLDDRCPMQIASTGHSKVMIGIASRKILNTIAPDNAQLVALSKRMECNGYFVFTFDTNQADCLTEGRMFAPAIGISEDPVTGNANGPLGAYLVHNKIGQYEDSVFRFIGYQGESIGRPGKVAVEVAVKDGMPSLVKITGEAVVVFTSHIRI